MVNVLKKQKKQLQAEDNMKKKAIKNDQADFKNIFLKNSRYHRTNF